MDVTNLSHYALAKGIKTSWNEMSQAQQTMLRYQYLMSVTKDKQGDFTRTQNTFANQVRLAKVNLQQLGASIGTYALPPLNKILNAFNNGGMKSIGTVVGGAFASIANVAKSLSKPMQDLWKSLGNFSKAAGITSLFKNLFSGVDTKDLQKVKDLLAGLLNGVKSFVDYCAAHIGTIKILFAGLGGALVGIKIANEFLKVRNAINGVKKAGEGLSGFSKFSNIFNKIFGKSPQFALFTIAIAGIGIGIYELAKHWTTVQPIMNKFFNQMHGGLVLSTSSALLLFGAMLKFNTVSHIFNFIDGAKSKFNSLKSTGTGALNSIKKVGSGIGTGFSKGAGFVKTLGSNLLGVGKNALIAAKNVALMGLGIAKQGAIFIINAARMAIFKGATLGIAAAQKIAAGAQRLLNLAMNANPIIKVISVIIALGSALVVLYQKNVWFRNKVNAVFASFKTLPAKFRGWAHDMINGFVKGIEEKFAPIKKAAKAIADIVKKFLHFSKPDEGPLQQYGQWMPDMITGMSTGMTAASPILWRSTNNMTAGMANTVQAYVNTGRPSGANSVNGIASGVNAASPNAWKSTSNMTAGMSGRLMIFTNSCNPVGISAVNELAKGIANSGAQSNILSVVKTLTDKVINAFRNGFGIASPSKVFFKIGNYIVQGFINGLTNKDMGKFIKKWIGSITGSVSGDLSGWLTAAMAITGTPMSYLPALESIAMHESGGNPKAINLWDINAIEGHPSKGLMQMIDSSFSRYAIPGLGDIWNPVANAAASIRYMIGTYGSIANVPGIRSMMHGGGYVGYIDGTDNAKRGFAALSENGEPELVVGKQYRYFEGGEQVVNSKRLKSLFNKSGESKFTVNLNIQGNVIGNEQYAKEMGEYLGNTVISAIENM